MGKDNLMERDDLWHGKCCGGFFGDIQKAGFMC
jgi:hypothetical protein